MLRTPGSLGIWNGRPPCRLPVCGLTNPFGSLSGPRRAVESEGLAVPWIFLEEAGFPTDDVCKEGGYPSLWTHHRKQTFMVSRVVPWRLRL